MNVAQFVKETTEDLSEGRFSKVLKSITRRFPAWLIRYNKADFLRTKIFEYAKEPRYGIKVRTAEKSDIDSIHKISGIDKSHIEYLLDKGVTCFLASDGDSPPASVAWNAFGKVYVRGMGFEYDFGKSNAYGFWSATLPEARGKGLHYALMVYKARYVKEHGARYSYSLIEFDNSISYKIRMNLGFEPILKVYRLTIFGINFVRIVDYYTKKSIVKVFSKPDLSDAVLI